MREPDDGFDERVRAEYRHPDADDEMAKVRAIARLRRDTLARPGRLARLFAPRSFTARPVVALAACAALLVAGTLIGMRIERGRPGGAVVPGARTPLADAGAIRMATASVPVVFVLRAPGASKVNVVGDFNGWDALATPLSRAGGDLWMVRVNVERGVHRYSFVLDGSEWRPDPAAPLAADPAFGGRSSVLMAGGESPL